VTQKTDHQFFVTTLPDVDRLSELFA